MPGLAILRPMASFGEHDDVPHTLIPLALAVGLIRAKVYGARALTGQGRDGDLNMIAGLVAGLVSLYECGANPARPPRLLRKTEVDGGIFRDGGKELRFIDGRSTKRDLAANAVDVEFVTALLKEPEHAVTIHSRFVRLRAQKLKARARAVRAAAAQLRNEAMALRAIDCRSGRGIGASAPETPSPASPSRR
jgi:hypothetical protein